jgi:O-antigen ligase
MSAKPKLSPTAPAVDSASSPWPAAYAGLLGLWVALVLIKFGTPIILDSEVPAPANLDELRISSWPVRWGYALTVVVFLLGCTRWRRPVGAPLWLLGAPAFWLAWQCLAGARSVDATLSQATLPHFAFCVALFYLGVFKAQRCVPDRLFWPGVVGGFLVVLVIGWRQHFGGLQETRQLFFSLPDWQSYPPELIKKLSSERIFGTMFYPNALAGAILLFLPLALGGLLELSGPRASSSTQFSLHRWLLGSLIIVLALGALYWSGSKAGWLIFLGQGMAVLLLAPVPRRLKVGCLLVALLLGGGGFWLRYQGYFSRGATSVSARFDYWRSAWVALGEHPWLGTGPGTFGVVYRRLKQPEAEMTRLVHNDYLQQGSDSGWPGLVAYAAWVLGGLALAAKRLRHGSTPLAVGAGLGLAGFAVQSFVEFGLYIPALAWPAFLLLGCSASPVRGQRDPAQPGAGREASERRSQ